MLHRRQLPAQSGSDDLGSAHDLRRIPIGYREYFHSWAHFTSAGISTVGKEKLLGIGLAIAIGLVLRNGFACHVATFAKFG